MGRGRDIGRRKTRCDRHYDRDIVYCRECQETFRRSALSKAGLCPLCGAERQLEASRQIKGRVGPIYDRWLEHRRCGLANSANN